jgi:nucleotide-binding universal stress UspA family protein
LRWALEEASVAQATLDVVHAWDVPYERDVEALEQAATAFLDAEVAAATERTGSGPRQIDKLVARGSAAAVLLGAAKGADLLVVGSRGRGGFRGLLLGSVSNQCVQHAACPVVVIRGTAEAPEPGPILVGVDGSEFGAEALRWAIANAVRKRQRVVALAAWSWLDQPGEFNPDYGEKDVRMMAEAAVGRARDAVSESADADVEIRIVNDHAAPALIDASQAAGLLVVGSRGLGGFRGLLLGSVSNKCVHHAHCPVVVVRTT